MPDAQFRVGFYRAALDGCQRVGGRLPAAHGRGNLGNGAGSGLDSAVCFGGGCDRDHAGRRDGDFGECPSRRAIADNAVANHRAHYAADSHFGLAAARQLAAQAIDFDHAGQAVALGGGRGKGIVDRHGGGVEIGQRQRVHAQQLAVLAVRLDIDVIAKNLAHALVEHGQDFGEVRRVDAGGADGRGKIAHAFSS